MQTSGLLIVNATHVESQVSMAIDDTDLQASAALKKTTVRKYILTFGSLHLFPFHFKLFAAAMYDNSFLLVSRIEMKHCLI